MTVTTDLGNVGFKWFFGIVKNVMDEDELGAVQVFVPGMHDGIPEEDLPWAQPLGPMTSSSLMGIGRSPTGIQVGSWVWGFFADGQDTQLPFYVGTLWQILGGEEANHGVSKLARGENFIDKELLGPEPESAYGAEYPHNQTYTTPSGHVIEVDDTEGAERLHIYHKAGTYIEINKDGRYVGKTAGDHYQIVAGSEEVYIKGNVNIHVVGNVTQTIDGDFDMQVGGDASITASGDLNLVGNRINLN